MDIVLIDDHQIIRQGLRSILERAPGLRVVGEAADGQAGIALVVKLHPDLVVMDVSMPGMNGIEATKHIAAARPSAKIIALSMHSDRRNVVAMLSAGASGYLLKSAASDELLRAVEAVTAGRTYLSPDIAGVVVDSLRQQGAAIEGREPVSELTAREREVLQLLAEGLSSKEIAARLDVAVTTIETHRRQIMAKLNLRSIAELTKYAIREGLTSVDR